MGNNHRMPLIICRGRTCHIIYWLLIIPFSSSCKVPPTTPTPPGKENSKKMLFYIVRSYIFSYDSRMNSISSEREGERESDAGVDLG